ncbi:hypothetical protein ACFE04_012642 [Oxalis oulophora]
MVLHILALAKLKLLSSSSHGINPLLTSLLCPFMVKLSMSYRIINGAYFEMLHSSRLFVFQLGQIVFNGETSGERPAGVFGNNTRFERAMRLVHQRLTLARRSSRADQSHEDSFHTLTMLSL